MGQNLIKNTSLYAIGSILPKFGALIFLPIYTSYLTTSQFGIISSLHILDAIFGILFTLTFPKALYRLYYDYKSVTEKKQLSGTILISIFLFAIISLLLIYIFDNYVSLIFKSISFYPYFQYSILISFFSAFHALPMVMLQIKEKVKHFVFTSLSLFILKNGFIIFNVVFRTTGAIGYLEAEMISCLIFVPIYLFLMKDDFSLSWNNKMFISVLTFSIPLIPNVLSSWILQLSDRLFIERYFSTGEVGIYSLGYQIAGIILVFSNAFKSAYDPYFYKLANTLDERIAKPILYKTNNAYLIVLIIGSFLIAFFSKEIIMLVFNKSYYGAIHIVPLISIGYFLSQNSGLLNVMMYQKKKTKFVMFLMIIGAIFNILLNFVLIPKYGILGGAWSTIISYFIVFVISYSYAKKSYFVPYNWSKLIPIIVGLFCLYSIFDSYSPSNIKLLLLIKSAIVLIIILITLLKSKNIYLEYFRNFFVVD